jgi:hypothetical protein
MYTNKYFHVILNSTFRRRCTSVMHITAMNGDTEIKLDQCVITLPKQGRILTPLTPTVADDLVCNICLETLLDVRCGAYTCATTNCKCVYCTSCVRQWITVTQPYTCAFCKTSTTLLLIHSVTPVEQCSVQQPEQRVIQLGVSTYTGGLERPYHISRLGLLLCGVGVMLHVLLHTAVMLKTNSCLDPTSHTQQDVQICIVSAVMYLTLSCAHVTVAMVTVLCCNQELLLCYGLISISIWVGRIIIFTMGLEWSNGDDEAILLTGLLLAGSITSSMFDWSFYSWSSVRINRPV